MDTPLTLPMRTGRYTTEKERREVATSVRTPLTMEEGSAQQLRMLTNDAVATEAMACRPPMYRPAEEKSTACDLRSASSKSSLCRSFEMARSERLMGRELIFLRGGGWGGERGKSRRNKTSVTHPSLVLFALTPDGSR